jgi:hypothetical protein
VQPLSPSSKAEEPDKDDPLPFDGSAFCLVARFYHSGDQAAPPAASTFPRSLRKSSDRKLRAALHEGIVRNELLDAFSRARGILCTPLNTTILGPNRLGAVGTLSVDMSNEPAANLKLRRQPGRTHGPVVIRKMSDEALV